MTKEQILASVASQIESSDFGFATIGRRDAAYNGMESRGYWSRYGGEQLNTWHPGKRFFVPVRYQDERDEVHPSYATSVDIGNMGAAHSTSRVDWAEIDVTGKLTGDLWSRDQLSSK